MNDKFHKIGIVTEDDLIDLIDYLNDEVLPIKQSLYGFFSDECAFSLSGSPAYVTMAKYKDQYCVYVTCEFSEEYDPETRYDLCDIFNSYEDADEYFNSLKNKGLKSGKEQMIECQNKTIEPKAIWITCNSTKIEFKVFYLGRLLIEHMKCLDYEIINNAIREFDDFCEKNGITIDRITKKRPWNSYQRFYVIEYTNQNYEQHTAEIHIPSALQRNQRSVVSLIKENDIV